MRRISPAVGRVISWAGVCRRRLPSGMPGIVTATGRGGPGRISWVMAPGRILGGGIAAPAPSIHLRFSLAGVGSDINLSPMRLIRRHAALRLSESTLGVDPHRTNQIPSDSAEIPLAQRLNYCGVADEGSGTLVGLPFSPVCKYQWHR